MLRSGAIGAVVLIASVAAGCSLPGATDKAGSDTLVLEIATIDGQLDGSSQAYAAQTFVRALSEVSAGRIQVHLTTSYGDDEAVVETDLVRAIAAGEVDAGWPASRAFAGAGIPGLAALEAPMVVTSYDAQRALVDGPAADLVVEDLEGTGIHGLGLAVGSLRRPFGVADYFDSPDDWDGARFRSFNSPLQTAAIEAWGGTAVQAGNDWFSLARAGELDGAEFDVAQYLANEFGPTAGMVTSNIVLWPEMLVLTINQDRWSQLTEEQRGWITSAAADAVRASVEGDYSDSDIAEELCSRGVRFRAADLADLVSLRAAVRPVIRDLAADPREAPLLRQVRDAVRRHWSTDEIEVPASCGSRGQPPEVSEIPDTLAPIPNGTYRAQVTESDVAAAGLTNNDGTSGTWTLEVDDGRWYLSCRPVTSPGLDCGQEVETVPLDAGRFYGDDRQVWIVHDPALLAGVTGCELPADGSEGHCEIPLEPVMVEWSVDGDELTFRNPAAFDQFELILKPFVRIG